MKRALIRVLRLLKKILYLPIHKVKGLVNKQTAPNRIRSVSSRPDSQRAAASHVRPAAAIPSISGTHARQHLGRKGHWWMSKPALAGAASVIVIIAVVLIFTLPRPSADAGVYDVTGSAYASLSGTLDTSTPAPTHIPSAPTPTVDLPIEVPTTAPEAETPLQPGIHDPRVIELQSRLMNLGYMDNDEPTDYYGGGTKFALQLFQRKHSLQIDGLLGTNTQSLLYSDNAMPYTVKLGDKGSDVKEIQQRLKVLKYFSGSVTGDFGEKTEAAVKSFQKRNGLSEDGNIGEHTREILFSEDAKEAKSSSSGGSSRRTINRVA